MSELTERFKPAMVGVDHTFAQIGEAAGFTPDAVTKVMTGKTKNPSERIVLSIFDALDRLRGTCPHCGQKLPPKGPRNAVVRRREEGRKPTEA